MRGYDIFSYKSKQLMIHVIVDNLLTNKLLLFYNV